MKIVISLCLALGLAFSALASSGQHPCHANGFKLILDEILNSHDAVKIAELGMDGMALVPKLAKSKLNHSEYEQGGNLSFMGYAAGSWLIAETLRLRVKDYKSNFKGPDYRVARVTALRNILLALVQQGASTEDEDVAAFRALPYILFNGIKHPLPDTLMENFEDLLSDLQPPVLEKARSLPAIIASY